MRFFSINLIHFSQTISNSFKYSFWKLQERWVNVVYTMNIDPVAVYPSPVTEILNMKWSGESLNGRVEVTNTDISGKTTWTSATGSDQQLRFDNSRIT